MSENDENAVRIAEALERIATVLEDKIAPAIDELIPLAGRQVKALEEWDYPLHVRLLKPDREEPDE